MKILVIAQRLPNRLDEGAKFITACDLASLSTLGEVVVLPFEGGDEWNSALPILKEYGADLKNIRKHVFSDTDFHSIFSKADNRFSKIFALIFGYLCGLPYIVSRKYSASFKNAVRHALSKDKYDFVYLDGVSLAYLVDILVAMRIKYIYRCHDVISETFYRMSRVSRFPSSFLLRIEAKRAQRVDIHCALNANISICLSETNRDFLCAKGVEAVDVVKPYFVSPGIAKPSLMNSGVFTLGYLGTGTYPPNREGLDWFFAHVWPLVCERGNNIRLFMAGKGTESYGSHRNVESKGYIDQVVDLYSMVDMTVVPLFSGSGIRIKILDSLSYGVPVLSTNIGAEGIDISDSNSLILSDLASEWADKILEMSRTKRTEFQSLRIAESAANDYSKSKSLNKFAALFGAGSQD